MKRIQICGHRGYPEKYPQNTLVSFEAAIRAGCDRIEYDVHWTRDRHLVICHNATIDETSDGHGAIAEMTWQELQRYDFGSYLSPRFAGVRLPELPELLDLTNQLAPGLFHLVELKINSVEMGEAVLAELFRRRMTGRFTLVSFHLPLLIELKRRHPQIMTHANPDCALTAFVYEDYRPFDSVGLWRERVTPEVAAGFHAVGVAVDAWTVDTAAEFDRQQRNGVDSVTSNCPATIIEHCRQKVCDK